MASAPYLPPPLTPLNIIGDTTYTTVYEAKDSDTGALRACKVANYADVSELTHEDIAQIMLMYGHFIDPNIVHIYSATSDARRHAYYLVMEECVGNLENLVQYYRLHEEIIPEPVVLEILAQVVSATAYLHNPHNKQFKGYAGDIYTIGCIIHRNINPLNVLVAENGYIKLSDMPPVESLFHHGLLANFRTKCSFCAPELLSETDEYDEKVDVWSIGALGYYLCSLAPVVSGADSALVYQRMKSLTPEDTAIPNVYSNSLKTLIQELLTVDQDRRPTIFDVIVHPLIVSAAESISSAGPQPLQLEPVQRTSLGTDKSLYHQGHDTSMSQQSGISSISLFNQRITESYIKNCDSPDKAKILQDRRKREQDLEKEEDDEYARRQELYKQYDEEANMERRLKEGTARKADANINPYTAAFYSNDAFRQTNKDTANYQEQPESHTRVSRARTFHEVEASPNRDHTCTDSVTAPLKLTSFRATAPHDSRSPSNYVGIETDIKVTDASARDQFNEARPQDLAEMRKSLLSQKRTYDAIRDELHNTPLMTAVLDEDINGVMASLSYAKETNSLGKTALMYAAEKNFSSAVKILAPLEAGMVDPNGVSALQMALLNNSLNSAKILTPAEGFDPKNPAEDVLGTTELMVAAQRGDIVTAWCLLPYQSNKADHLGKTALIYALENDWPELARILAPREGGFAYKPGSLTALHICAMKNYAAVAVVLSGKEAGIRTKDGETALHIATRNKFHDVMKVLVDIEGCITNGDGHTALMIAALSNDPIGAGILVAKEGAILSPDGKSALELALERSYFDVAEAIAPEEAYRFKNMGIDTDGVTDLMMATENKDIVAAYSLMRQSRLMDNSNTSALVRTIQAQSVDDLTSSFVKMLAGKESSLRHDVMEKKQLSPLSIAVLSGNYEAAAELAKIDGMNPDNYEPRGMRKTELMQVAEVGDVGNVWCLRSQAGLTDKDGTTALMLAAQNGHLECVKLLFEYEKGMRRTEDNKSALELAVENGHIEIAKLLNDAEGTAPNKAKSYGYCKTDLINAVITNKPVDVWSLAMTQARLHDEYGKTALMYAAERNFTNLIKILVEPEAGMTMLSEWRGATALMWAARLGHYEACELLVSEAGAQDSYGMTALILAAEANFDNVVQLLVQYEKGIRMFNSRTACMRAAENFCLESLRLLLPEEGHILHHTGKSCLDLAMDSKTAVEQSRKFACLSLLKKYYKENPILADSVEEEAKAV